MKRPAKRTDAPIDLNGVERQKLLGVAWRKSTGGLLAIALFSIFINVLKLATPIYILQVLDRVIASRSYETLAMLTTITIVAIVTGILLELVRRRMFMGWGVWLDQVLSPRLFTDSVNESAVKSKAISQSLRDISTLRSFVSGTALVAWLDLIWAPLFILGVWLIAPMLGYIIIVASLISAALGLISELVTRDSRNATYKAGKDDREWVAATERNLDSVVSRNMAKNISERWSRSSSMRISQSMRTRATTLYFASAMLMVRRSLRIFLLCVGMWFVIDDVMTVGEVIAAGVLARMAYLMVEKAMLKWRDLSLAIKAYRSIKQSLSRSELPAVSVFEVDNPLSLVIDGLSFRYPQQPKSVFRQISVTVDPGEMLCVVGVSAAGKTTLTRLISGSLRPRSGKICLGDFDVARLQELVESRFIGHLPQQAHLFTGSVRENIAAMSEGDIDQVVAAAKLLGVHKTILKLPSGYDTKISENEPLLSQGQRKKIALARAFYGNPRLIVMDEPMPNLDRRSRAALRRAILRRTSEGAIVVITTQSKSLTRIAHKVLAMDEGKCTLLDSQEKIQAFRGRGTQRAPNNTALEVKLEKSSGKSSRKIIDKPLKKTSEKTRAKNTEANQEQAETLAKNSGRVSAGKGKYPSGDNNGIDEHHIEKKGATLVSIRPKQKS